MVSLKGTVMLKALMLFVIWGIFGGCFIYNPISAAPSFLQLASNEGPAQRGIDVGKFWAKEGPKIGRYFQKHGKQWGKRWSVEGPDIGKHWRKYGKHNKHFWQKEGRAIARYFRHQDEQQND